MQSAQIHHVGIGVRDLDASLALYEKVLGIEHTKRLEWPNLGLRAAVIQVGETLIELIEPYAPQGIIPEHLARQVDEQDGAIHHLAFAVPDLDAAVVALRASKIAVIGGAPQTVAGGQIAWLCPNPNAGGMIELVEAGYEVC